MQYVGSPQTTFRFGSTPTRSMSISSLASMAESAEEAEDGDHGETAAHYFSRRFSVGSFHQRRRSGSVQSLSSMDGARAGSVGNNLSLLGSSAEGHHGARPRAGPRAIRARRDAREPRPAALQPERLAVAHVVQPHVAASPPQPPARHQPVERRSSLGRAGCSPETRVVGFGEGSTTTTPPIGAIEEAETARAQRAYLGASDDDDDDDDGDGAAPGDGEEEGAGRSGAGRGGAGGRRRRRGDGLGEGRRRVRDGVGLFPAAEREIRGRLGVLLHCVSFTSALIIAAPLPLAASRGPPRVRSRLDGAIFGAFAVGTVVSTKAFNSFTNADGGRAALMIVGLFLQGAAGMLFGVAGELGFSNPAACCACFRVQSRGGVGVRRRTSRCTPRSTGAWDPTRRG